MDKKIVQLAITNEKTGETSLSGVELGDDGFDLTLETIFKVDKIKVNEFDTNSQVMIFGRGLDNSNRTFPCEISYLFFPSESFEKHEVLKIFHVEDIKKLKGGYYFAYGITFLEYPEVSSLDAQITLKVKKIFVKNPPFLPE